MPLPFILAGAAAVTIGTGIKKGIDGFKDNSAAKDITEAAESLYDTEKSYLMSKMPQLMHHWNH
ncbi:hypothetical protein Q7306_08090 [Glaesserella parasuis]|nr:hypothetical protein [Glaesserella parasuis]